jgi:asparagine synthase (glutamine-hydrolysing)
MCGLVGFVGRGDRGDLDAMMGALRHRGPDGEGSFVHTDSRVHLGHLRLAILDIVGGVQPMWNEDGTVGVIYNGEIYNHAQLRRDLEARGHVFRSDHSDTEVLVHFLRS